jgi:hypothetical protein
MGDPAKSGAKPRLEGRLRNYVSHIRRKQRSGMVEIWLESAQRNLMRLACEYVAALRACLDLLNQASIPVPHAQLQQVAFEVQVVRVEVDGFVGGWQTSSLVYSLNTVGLRSFSTANLISVSLDRRTRRKPSPGSALNSGTNLCFKP